MFTHVFNVARLLSIRTWSISQTSECIYTQTHSLCTERVRIKLATHLCVLYGILLRRPYGSSRFRPKRMRPLTNMAGLKHTPWQTCNCQTNQLASPHDANGLLFFKIACPCNVCATSSHTKIGGGNLPPASASATLATKPMAAAITGGPATRATSEQK